MIPTTVAENAVHLIIAGYNERAILAYIRTADNIGVDYRIVASSSRDNIYRTKYKDNILFERKSADLTLESIDNTLTQVRAYIDERPIVIIPSTESLNRFILDNREYYENRNVYIPLCSKSIYTRISDKYSFDLLCKRYGIRTPVKYRDTKRFPLVAKPKQYSMKGNIKPVIIKNNKDYQLFSNTHDIDGFYYQQYIDGESYYLLFYISDHEDVYKLSQRNLVQQGGGGSIVAAEISNLHEDEVCREYEDMLLSVGFTGLVMIELRGETRDRLYMIEANPRLWGPSQLFVDSEVNLFYPFIADTSPICKNIKRDTPKNVKYFWKGGISEGDTNELDVVYHNNEIYYKSRYDEFLNSDIYNRADSIEVYSHRQ